MLIQDVLKLIADIRAQNWLAAFQDFLKIVQDASSGATPPAQLDQLEKHLKAMK